MKSIPETQNHLSNKYVKFLCNSKMRKKLVFQKMLDAGVIQESNSDQASPLVFIRKKDGTIRYAIDYRCLNACTVKSSFCLPDIKHCISALNRSVYFSILDMALRYYQVKIAESDRHKTAFQTRFGLFEHVRMGFGLCNVLSMFQRIIQLIQRGLTWKTVLAYLDDVVILGNCFSDHSRNLKETLGFTTLSSNLKHVFYFKRKLSSLQR